MLISKLANFRWRIQLMNRFDVSELERPCIVRVLIGEMLAQVDFLVFVGTGVEAGVDRVDLSLERCDVLISLAVRCFVGKQN